jgi:imidazole glycerol phosphate synthase subunit HisF
MKNFRIIASLEIKSESGRIRSVSDIYKLFNIGADKVSINTSVFKNPQILNQASKIFDSQSICSHIQYENIYKYEKNPEVFSESGRETVRSLSAMGVEELRGADLSTRGPGWTYHWWTGCSASCSAG